MSSTGKRKKKKTFTLKEELKLDVHTITKLAKERKKCGLIVANAADIPLWMTDEELNKNIPIKRHKPAIYAESPLKGTFTDGFAMYSTFVDVENCDVKFIINSNGSEFLNLITNMFKRTENGVNDFFIYYSGIGKSFNGDWLSYNEENDKINIIPLTSIVKKWKSRPNQSKNQYLLLISDTNYSGIWVSKAKDLKLLKKHNILVQSSVSRDESSLEMTIGEIKPPCWISQIICGKFTHNWLEISSSQFYNINNGEAVMDMKGSFVILNKKMVWDDNEEYYAKTDNPMSNIFGSNDEKTIVVIPAFGYNNEYDHDHDHDDAMQIFNDENIEKELQNVLADIEKDNSHNSNEQKDEKEEKNENVKYATLKKGGYDNLNVKRRTSHLPQPSVRRLNLLQGVVGGLKLRKHKKKKSRHVSTYSRGFIFTKVLKDIRHMVMGSDDENDNNNNDNNNDWIDD